ncbi:AI-2E family transporter [Actinomadura barringtoniae]|uniref:AI-2E family transporter n=1 Tax=Actinomadura barringtoniae TaxID=1427535 RepID=A0A939T989_9ACTN|nr:AI-2E family transporter [Actinomadura barringtoniae]MBO2447730.1 AI-2E family transporter [Actinomadura barringtoniae]
MTEDRSAAEARPAPGHAVPATVAVIAAWAWRLVAIGVVVYGVVWIVGALKIVFLPCAIALFLCALLRPLAARLERKGLPPLVATWVTLLVALGVVGGIGTYVGIQANEEFPKLVSEVQVTSRQLQHWLENGPLHVKHSQLQNSLDDGVSYLEKRRGQLASTAVQASTMAAEVIVGFLFMLFVTFFLLKDGAQIWNWAISGMGRYRRRVDQAGRAGWETLSQYVRGTVMVAAIHAVILALALAILGVPLVAPLALIVFLGSFIPIVGILVGGGLAVAVTFGAKGGTAALIFLIVLVVEHQLESHLLQPLVVGRWVRLHPLAVIVSITVGGVLGGIPGAAVAVPVVAVLYRALPALRDSSDLAPAEPEPEPVPGTTGTLAPDPEPAD